MDFEKKIVDLKNKPADFEALYAAVHPDQNARAKVPILVHGNATLIESALICHYLEASFPGMGTQLLPSSPLERARIDLFNELFSSLITAPSISLLRNNDLKAREELENGLRALDTFLLKNGSAQGGDYFLGGQFSMAEVMTGPFILRRMVTHAEFCDFDFREVCERHGLKRMLAWMEAVSQRPSLVETIPSDEELFDGTRSMMQMLEGGSK